MWNVTKYNQVTNMALLTLSERIQCRKSSVIVLSPCSSVNFGETCCPCPLKIGGVKVDFFEDEVVSIVLLGLI